MAKFAADLHRKGELNKVDAMEKLAKRIERESRGGLGSAFLTEAYYGADCYAIIANKSDYRNKSGYVVYDEEQQKAVFIPDEE